MQKVNQKPTDGAAPRRSGRLTQLSGAVVGLIARQQPVGLDRES